MESWQGGPRPRPCLERLLALVRGQLLGAGLGGRPVEPLIAAGAGGSFPPFNLAVSFCPRKQISPKGGLWGGASHIAPGLSVPFLWVRGPVEGLRPSSGQH